MIRRRPRHPTIQRDPNTILMNWSRRQIKLRSSGRVLPPPSEKSKSLALKFLEWLRSKREYSSNTIHRYMITFKKIASWIEMWNKDIYDLTYDDWIKIINDLYDAEIHLIVKIIVKFLYEMTNNTKFFDIYKKIKVPRRRKIVIQILSEDQVQKLIEVCSKIDFELKVLVEIIYETGARISEILSLRRKDIEFDEYGAKIYIRNSKSVARSVRVILFASDLLRLCDGLSHEDFIFKREYNTCLLYTSPSPRDLSTSRMPSSA